MRFGILLISHFWAWNVAAQYIPGGMNYGFGAVANIGAQQQFGLSPRIEYAPTCYTSYLLEYGYFFSAFAPKKEGVHELAFSVNTIVFNFDPVYVTAGLGYMANTSKAFETMEKEALLFFRTGGINHGLQLKIRTLIRLSLPLHLFAALNIKSLGRYYDTVGVGLLYDFDLK